MPIVSVNDLAGGGPLTTDQGATSALPPLSDITSVGVEGG